VIAVAFVAAALSLILLALGHRDGFISRFAVVKRGASASTVSKAAIFWLIAVQIIASGMGDISRDDYAQNASMVGAATNIPTRAASAPSEGQVINPNDYGRCRDTGCPVPPQRSVRALVSAYGSYLGWLAAKRLLGRDGVPAWVPIDQSASTFRPR